MLSIEFTCIFKEFGLLQRMKPSVNGDSALE